MKRRKILVSVLAMLLIACGPLGRSREGAIEEAIEQVRETMRIAFPDLPHPEPYKYEDSGDCALVPGLNSSKETLRYQAEILLPEGDNGIDRQARALKHWVDKGGTIRELPYLPGPPNEVNYRGGSIMAFSTGSRPGMQRVEGREAFWIVATTPCIPKAE